MTLELTLVEHARAIDHLFFRMTPNDARGLVDAFAFDDGVSPR